jgi:hypothetical protein
VYSNKKQIVILIGKSNSIKMSLPRAGNRKTSNAGHTDKTNSDKKKHASRPTETKNGTHGKKETQEHSKTHRKSSIAEHTKTESKLNTKKHISTDNHTKTTHAGNIYKNKK